MVDFGRSPSRFRSLSLAAALLPAATMLACTPGDGDDVDAGDDAADAGDLDGGAGDDGATDGGIAADGGSSPDAGDLDGGDGDDEATDGGIAADGGSSPDAGGIGGDGDGDGGPSSLGPFTTTSTTASLTRDGRTIPVKALAPQGASDPPLVVFVPGFQLDAVRYEATAAHLASWGFLVVLSDPPDPLFGIDHVAMALDVSAVIDWAIGPGGFTVDEERVGVMGHSLGGKVSLMAAARDARIDAVLGLDPVNGANPITGYSETLPDITAGEVQTLALPIGLVGETTDATAGLGGQACAPADQNYATLFDAATAATPSYAWTIDGADHMDFVDDVSGCGFTCGACQDGARAEAEVQAVAHTLAAAFFRRWLGEEAAMDAWLLGTELPAWVATETGP